MTISAIVPVWNGSEMLLRLLDTLPQWGRLLTCGGLVTRATYRLGQMRRFPIGLQDSILPHQEAKA